MEKGLLEKFIAALISFINEFFTGEKVPKGTPWEQFIFAARNYSGLPDHVKLVMVAQAINESARGTSDKAINANNFLGMKYRKELESVATEYMTDASDHKDLQAYAKFKTIEAGVEGYKLFIQRSPYKGWDKTTTALEYLTLIKKAGYAESPTYITKISALFAEAQRLLETNIDVSEPEHPDTGDDSARGVFVLKVGHLAVAKGASMTGKIGPNEYDYYKLHIAPMAVKYAAEHYPKIKVHIVLRDGMGITETYNKRIKPLDPDAVIELHYNGAGNSSVSGTETLCSNDSNDKAFAKIVQSKICDVFERGGNSRGVKVISKSTNGGSACHALPGIPNCLIEPAFGSNTGDAKMLMEKREELAKALVESFVEMMKA